MKFPDFFNGMTPRTFMQLPKPYQEYLVRWYYYDNTNEKKIPDTVPVENIEDYIVQYFSPSHMWCAKGFACARNVDAGDNLDFKDNVDFYLFTAYIAALYYVDGLNNNYFDENVTEKVFREHCHALGETDDIPL